MNVCLKWDTALSLEFLVFLQCTTSCTGKVIESIQAIKIFINVMREKGQILPLKGELIHVFVRLISFLIVLQLERSPYWCHVQKLQTDVLFIVLAHLHKPIFKSL